MIKSKIAYSKISILTGFALFLVLVSCTKEARQSFRPVPTAFGKINQITIIADKSMWESAVGDTLRNYYESAYLILPQPEPNFDLWYFSPEELEAERTRREMRNYIILANLNDASSPATKLILNDIGAEKARRAKEDPTYNTAIGRDKWAEGQMLIYQFAYSDDDLIKNIKKNFPAIAQRIRKTDEEKIDASLFLDGENRKLMSELQEKLGVEMRIPSDFKLATSNEEIIWMRRDGKDFISNLILKKIPYTDQSQLTKEGIKIVRDTIGKKYISSQIANSYMRINDVDLPMFVNTTTLNNKYALEARGIWEMENDYMGGAFLSYLIHNPNKNELLFVDGFVYAPGKDKRDLMQHLEYIISSIKI